MSSQGIAVKNAWELLLAPISAASPTGECLRYEGAYDRIMEARREDDPTLSQGVWKTTMKRADWAEVERICVIELQTRSKDLQIAAWLMEAWLHRRGFEGAGDGLELVKELLERYWETLHPEIDNGDMEFRIAPITWINEKLSVQLKLLPITGPASDEAPAFRWTDWENACRMEPAEARTRGASADRPPGKMGLPELQKSVMLTPTEFFTQTAAELERAMEACTAIEALLDRDCGKEAPSLRQLWNVMDAERSLLASWLAQRPSGEEPEEGGEAQMQSMEPAPEDPVMWTEPQGIRSRDEAYRKLAEAADFLARTEPHSPTPYLVRRAIAWGSLSLPQLLRELVRNENELGEISRLLQLGEKPNK